MMKDSRRYRFARRSLLAGVGATGAAALLRSILARAQSGTAPQRILLIHRPCGTVPDKWWPTGGITDWVSSPILAPFDKLRNDMVILKGVDCPRVQQWLGDKGGAAMIAMMAPSPMDKGDDHHVWPVLPQYPLAQQEDTNAKFFTSTDKTIDQLFLEKIPGLQGALIPSVQLTASSSSADATADCCVRVVSYSKPDPSAQFPTPLWPEYRPSVAASNIFGRALGMNPSNLASQALDQSLLDFISGDLNRLRPRLPASQLPKIDAHLTAIRDLEKNLSQGGTGRACTPPTLGPLPTPMDGMSTIDTQYLEICKQQMQVIKTAFQCDLTRVLSFTFAWADDDVKFVNVLPPGTITNTEGHHDISHNGGSNPLQALEAIETFYSNMTASLLLDMKNTPDGDTGASLLDNTLVVYWNHFSLGNPSDTVDIPILLFGGKFLNLQGGKYLQFGNNARTMADFWVQTAQTWGYKEMTSYGAPMWNKGPMPGIYG